MAVDFTVSNGDPTQPDSLHYYDRDRPENPYTMAIKTIGDIFQDYDYGERGSVGRGMSKCAVRVSFNRNRTYLPCSPMTWSIDVHKMNEFVIGLFSSN